MVDARLLNAIFRFKHRTPGHDQTPAQCAALVALVRASVEAITEAPCCEVVQGSDDELQEDWVPHLDPLMHDRMIPVDQFTRKERAELARMQRLLQPLPADSVPSRGDVWCETWFPEYAGVLQMQDAGVDTLHVQVLALDDWGRVLHFLADGSSVSSAEAKSLKVLNCGRISWGNRMPFSNALNAELQQAMQRTGTNRSAANGRTVGHQKTPTFLAAMLRKSICKVGAKWSGSTSFCPDGGMTDVGMHTGGMPRDTCWPLVCAAIRQFLPGCGALFDKFVIALKCDVLDKELEALRDDGCLSMSDTMFRAHSNDSFAILESVAIHTIELGEKGYDCGRMHVKCETWRNVIDEATKRWSDNVTAAFQLPSSDELRGMQNTVQYPCLEPPLCICWDDLRQPIGDIRAAALNQIRDYEFVDGCACSAATLIQYLSAGETDRHQYRKTAAFRAIDNFMYVQSARLTHGRQTNDAAADDLTTDDLFTVVEWYKKHMQPTTTVGYIHELMPVQRRSRYHLVTWIAFCIAHQMCRKPFRLVEEYGIALDWRRLEVCVLDERSARDALQNVVEYLRSWGRRNLSPLFHLETQEPTLEFSRRMGELLPQYLITYGRILEKVRTVLFQKWEAIKARKARIRVLDGEIAQAQREIENKESLLTQEINAVRRADPARWKWVTPYNDQTSYYERSIASRKKKLRQKQQEKSRLERLHEFVVSPLPAAKCDSLEVLFLLDPPEPLDILGHLCCVAQHALNPEEAEHVYPQCGARWMDHFNTYSFQEENATTQLITAFPRRLAVPSSYGPNHVDCVSSLDDFRQTCLWFPEGGNTWLAWSGCPGRYINPYKISSAASITYFTAAVPLTERIVGNCSGESEPSWQWAIKYPGGKTRGNIGYANADQYTLARDDFSAYTSLAALRAFPMLQLRKVFIAMEDDTLPWDNPIVETVVRQAIYQVGELTDEQRPNFLWHVDLCDSHMSGEFAAILERLVENVEASPARRWKCIPLLGELAGFLAQFSANARLSVAGITRVARRLAGELRTKWQEGVTTSEQCKLRSREALLYGFALIGYTLGNHPTSEELLELCELLILFHNSKLFAIEPALLDTVRRVERSVQVVMSRRIASVMGCSDLYGSISDLCRLVNPRFPVNLQWNRHVPDSSAPPSFFTSWFEATDVQTERHYVVNFFDGLILEDGRPPGGLPMSIRQSTTYRELFGDQDFEVNGARGVFRSVYAVNGNRYYTFAETGGELALEEVCMVDNQSHTFQLCSQAWVTCFREEFPTQLGVLYSHWYWVERECVILRARQAAPVDVSFVVTFVCRDSSLAAVCSQVPRIDRALPRTVIFACVESKKYSMIVQCPPELLRVFSKFELASLIHTLVSPNGVLEIDMPRYGLRFFLDESYHIASTNYRGYVLATDQQMHDGLTFFHRHLVLKDSTMDCTRAQRRMIVPAGNVVLQDTNVQGNDHHRLVDVEVSPDASTKLNVAVVDEHQRFRVLTSESLETRLQLAALCAANGTRVPAASLCMTGGEAALQLLRGCAPSRPFAAVALGHIAAICNLGWLTPALKIKAMGLLDDSDRLAFLHCKADGSEKANARRTTRVAYHHQLDEYNSDCSQRIPPRNSLRQRLTRKEEGDIAGTTRLRHSSPFERPHAACEPEVALDNAPVDSDVIAKNETRLSSLIATPIEVKDSAIPQFPLDCDGRNTMSRHMLNDLKKSWHIHQANPARTLMCSNHDNGVAILIPHVKDMLVEVSAQRRQMWSYLIACVDSARSSWRDRLSATIHRVPTVTMVDLVRSVLDNDVLLFLAPRFSRANRERFRDATILLMELCVLEDKLTRVHQRAQASAMGIASRSTQNPSADQYFVDELLCLRLWDTRAHPYWLAFEVEGRLQIRPEQYTIAHHLINTPRSVCQLNMGRGKTRVILPMLLLYFKYLYARSTAPRVVRVHFLTPLLSETRQFMHRVLTAGILQLPFVEQPFERQTFLGHHDLLRMQAAVGVMARHGGFQIVAPEHRLSLQLKRLEMAPELDLVEEEDIEASTAVRETLDALLDGEQYIDLFDESDAVLHHKYHLVYAVGTPEALESGADRWVATEALLRVLNSPSSHRVQNVLQMFPELWYSAREYVKRLGSFNGFRLKTKAHRDTETDRKGTCPRMLLRRALVEDLIDHAPFEMKWLHAAFALRDDGNRDRARAREDLIRMLCDLSTDASNQSIHSLFPKAGDGQTQMHHQLLALRGLVGYGVFEHCLEKRNRVNYGLPVVGTRAKALAVPFTAADVPAERSEFCHPDVSIVLTLLAYYHAGLRNNEVRQAFEMLLSLDMAEQSQYYREWFSSVQSRLGDENSRAQLANVRDIVLDNTAQMTLLCDVYRHATEVINFFLNMCVFPSDTKQYPNRLARSAWDLGEGVSRMGFSGTNDNHRLLPRGFKQKEPDVAALRATNGRMLGLVLQTTRGYDVLDEGNEERDGGSVEAVPVWQALLNRALLRGCHALIDTGALLAGVPTHAAAAYLAKKDEFQHTGVTYFDSRNEWNAWVVLDVERHVVTVLTDSSIHERETFVIFDEARARGSDMKLLPHAVAALTLGPGLTKDKLMQGAGRMRQLGCDQALWFMSTSEVAASVATATTMESVASSSTSQQSGDNRVLPLPKKARLASGSSRWNRAETALFNVFSLKPKKKKARPAGKAELSTDYWTSASGTPVPPRWLARNVLQWVMENTQEQCTVGQLEWAESGSHYCAPLSGGVKAELLVDDWTLEGLYATAQSQQLIGEIVEKRLAHRFGDTDEKSEGELAQVLQYIAGSTQMYGLETWVETTAYGEECERELQVERELEEEREVQLAALHPRSETDWDYRVLLTATSVVDVLDITQAETMQTALSQRCASAEAIGCIAWHDADLYGTANFWDTVRATGTLTSYLRLIDVLVVFADNSVLLLSEREADAATRMLVENEVLTHSGPMRRRFSVIHFAMLRHTVCHLGEQARMNDVPLVRLGYGVSNGIPLLALMACRVFNAETDSITVEKNDSSSHWAAPEQALRQLLEPMRPYPRQGELREWVSARRFPQRWTRSHLHELAMRMDLEDCSAL